MNPALGSYVHTFELYVGANLWSGQVIPSEAMDRMFTNRAMKDLEREVSVRNPLAWKELHREFRRYCLASPARSQLQESSRSEDGFRGDISLFHQAPHSPLADLQCSPVVFCHQTPGDVGFDSNSHFLSGYL